MADALSTFSDQLIALKDFPVDSWDPPYCGELPIRISRDGRWHYQDSPIGRERLVQLFSRILRREGERYFLVTPGEKIGIQVDDAPFLAVHFEIEGRGEGQCLRFRSNAGGEFRLDAEHPLRVEVDPRTGEPSPYVLVRPGLWALLARPVYYELAALAEEAVLNGERHLVLHSAGQTFSLGCF